MSYVQYQIMFSFFPTLSFLYHVIIFFLVFISNPRLDYQYHHFSISIATVAALEYGPIPSPNLEYIELYLFLLSPLGYAVHFATTE